MTVSVAAVWKTSLDVPFVSAHSHCQPGNKFLLFFSTSIPFGFSQQPVGQGDNFIGLVEAIVLVSVLNRMASHSAFGIKGEYEQTAEPVFLVDVEDGFLTA